MGNCLGSQVDDAHEHDPWTNFVNPTSSVLFTPGTLRGNNNGSRMSVSSSSTDQSQVSSMTSDLAILKGEILPTTNLKEYSFAELKKATKNFNPDSRVGVGGFGTIFRGCVNERTLSPSESISGMTVAIKRLDMESFQGYQEWQSEVNFLGRLSHPNLVRLLGYCAEDKELLLVYAFIPYGSLENHLFRRSAGTEPLSWDVRLKIATGTARGLAFLHSSEKSIIHRDCKASNILLDGDYNAKIGDFGLAKLGPAGGESYVSTRVLGTYGYVAPEYVTTGHLYVKSDVYAFGVVLLELLTGRRALDRSRPKEQQNLVEWIKPKLSTKKLKSIMDASLQGQYSSKEAHFAAQLTQRCLDIAPTRRPSMREVVEVLEQIQAILGKAQQSRQGSSHSSSYRAGRLVGNRHHTSHSGTGVVAQRSPDQS